MIELDGILSEATACVGETYFLLPIDGGDPVYRERVYCYELYHQMRLLWRDEFGYTLGGEVDKSGHPKIRGERIRGAKPDFLVHKPGHMEGNYAVVEVKPIPVGPAAMLADVEKLAEFRADAGYQRAIYLIYGTRGDRIDQIARTVEAFVQETGCPGIELWHHSQPGIEAHRIG